MFEKFTQENKEAPKEESKPVMTAEQQKRTDEFLSEQEKQKEEIEAELTPENIDNIIEQRLDEIKNNIQERLNDPNFDDEVKVTVQERMKKLKELPKGILKRVLGSEAGRMTISGIAALGTLVGVALLSPKEEPIKSSRSSHNIRRGFEAAENIKHSSGNISESDREALQKAVDALGERVESYGKPGGVYSAAFRGIDGAQEDIDNYVELQSALSKAEENLEQE